MTASEAISENTKDSGQTTLSKAHSKPLLKLKLLDALRKGNYRDLKALLDTTFTPRDDPNVVQVTRLILHYAIQVAPFQLIKEIVQNNTETDSATDDESLDIHLNINEQDNNGNTPLHLAALQSRTDVVSLLMDHPQINDCIVNNFNLQPYEMCRNVNVAQLMQFKRSSYVAQIATEFRTAFDNRDFEHLESILSNQRNAQLLDINGTDPKTGDTVLHEFVKKRDLLMCRWLLEHGSDPFKRDSRGKLPIDLVKGSRSSKSGSSGSSKGKGAGAGGGTGADTKGAMRITVDTELRRMLEKAATEQSVIDLEGVSMISIPDTGSGAEAATSSQVEPAIVVTDTGVGTKIASPNEGKESSPYTSGSGSGTGTGTTKQLRILTPPTFRGYLKKWTNFAQGYKLRYFILSRDGTLSYYIDENDTQNVCRGSLNISNCSLHLDSSEKLKFEIIGGGRNNENITWHLKGNHPIETNRWVWAIQSAIRYAKDRRKGLVPDAGEIFNLGNASGSYQGKLTVNDQIPLGNELNMEESKEGSNRRRSREIKVTGEQQQYQQQLAQASSQEQQTLQPLTSNSKDNLGFPTGEGFEKSMNESIIQETSDNENEEEEDDEDEDEAAEVENNRLYDIETINGVDIKLIHGPFSQRLHILRESITIELSSLSELLEDKQQLSEHPENVIEVIETVSKSVQSLSQSFEKLNNLTGRRDKRLVSLLRKQYDMNSVWMKSMKELELELIEKDTKLYNMENERKELKKLLLESNNHGVTKKTSATMTSTPGEQVKSGALGTVVEGSRRVVTSEGEALNKIAEMITETGSSEESEVDEFFDAEDLTVHDETTVTSEELTAKEGVIVPLSQAQAKVMREIKDDSSFLGYESGFRTRLKIDADNRPRVSLWGVLKSMVGKDLTKIALPVAFNEPSSMLQRTVEDIEYMHLLQQAAKIPDSTLRMVYVAGFAVSPYASTIGRIAKPFNPLLGETFEYANPEQNYRVLTEQISHHPPISITWAESPSWDYYGESKVESKFTGRTFAIKHLGRWYVNLRPNSDDNEEPIQEEVYSYIKPAAAIIGILVGKPEFDNMGEMRIDNHTTGDYCILNFRARGWTSAGAFEVRGEIYNKNGDKCWILGGHWNESFYAKRYTKGDEPSPSSSSTQGKPSKSTRRASIVDCAVDMNDPKYDGTKFLVWRANKHVSGVPFNLTPFAVTLNDDNPELLKWVAPTDSRVRPDQRAMEEGRYDDAADEKFRLEEKQRATRKMREREDIKYEPKWFVNVVHSASSEKYWKFTGDYWTMRRNHDWSKCDDIF